MPIYNKPDKFVDLIGICVGCLDDATVFKPAAIFYAARGYAWDFLDPDVPKLPEWPRARTSLGAPTPDRRARRFSRGDSREDESVPTTHDNA